MAALSRRRFLALGAAAIATKAISFAEPQKHIVRTFLDDWIGGARSPEDVTARVQAAAAGGETVRLRSGFQCDLTRGIRFTSGTTFECDATSSAIFRLLTGPGHFDACDFQVGRLMPNRLAFLVNSARNVRLFGLEILTDEPIETRTLIALQLMDTKSCQIDSVHVRGLREQNGGYIRIDSDRESLLRNVGVHDCRMYDGSLPKLQGTGIDVDDNRIRGRDGRLISSEGLRIIGAVCENIEMASEIRPRGILETDGIKVKCEGTSVTISDLTVRNTGQGLDLWGSDCLVTGVHATDIHLSAVKLIYGAARNTIRKVECDGTGLAALTIGDASRLPGGPVARDNSIEINAINVGKFWPEISRFAPQAAFQVEGDHQRDLKNKPSGNVIAGRADGYMESGRSFMPYVGFNLDAGVNTFNIGGQNYGIGVLGKSGSSSPIVHLE